MVKATRGLFIRTDMSIKEIIYDKARKYNVLIEDIDDNSVFVKDDEVDLIKNSLKTLKEQTNREKKKKS